ncbi:hypothetical protein PC129_g15551 [Phytophthora cactorum]|uniref:Uncharacterized protein n=1 Tax=Phytophthora cactorum TaxID=29920 RepID=A0A8T1KF27_9STRA|nr:hypothetical protein PC120_g15474 [Phytophthora cactorum]KAG3157775.1 hypothetical protein C6341_g14645 [Phytophthora cactorum]KAG3213509.1 hypothetical protein PC129_g15551 [Phytophthora cactorum]KAG4234326.1 hypothetical protein PC116_g17518 [Phytophthora cactorum]
MWGSSGDDTRQRFGIDATRPVLAKWYKFTEQWVNVTLKQTSGGQFTAADFTRLLLVRSGEKMCWRLEALFKHVDICRWFRETGAV